MYPKIGSAPTTDPMWVDNRLMNNQPIDAKEAEIGQKQVKTMTEAQSILNRTVLKGDVKGAQAQEKDLKELFKNLSTEEKQFMYNSLNSKNKMAETFQYRLATAQRERLFKVLNPDHVSSPQATAKMRAAEKASKANELNASSVSRQNELNRKVQ